MGSKQLPNARNTGRRGFFRRLLGEAVSFGEEMGGRPQMCMEQLDTLPDEVLRGVEPVWSRSRRVRLRGCDLMIEEGHDGRLKLASRLEEGDAELAALFGRGHTLEQLAARLACRVNLEQDAAWAEVKDLFLRLARQGLCHPSAPIE